MAKAMAVCCQDTGCQARAHVALQIKHSAGTTTLMYFLFVWVLAWAFVCLESPMCCVVRLLLWLRVVVGTPGIMRLAYHDFVGRAGFSWGGFWGLLSQILYLGGFWVRFVFARKRTLGSFFAVGNSEH